MIMSETEINWPALDSGLLKSFSRTIAEARSSLNLTAGAVRPTTLLPAVWLLAFLTARTDSIAAPTVSHFKLMTAPGTIGTLSVAEDGNAVDTDFRVDDNGR